jgi:hypothetical protein
LRTFELTADSRSSTAALRSCGLRDWAQSGATKVPSADEFDLKQAVRNLFDELVRLGEGVISRLEFRHGLPFLLETVAGAVPEDPTNAPASLEGRK